MSARLLSNLYQAELAVEQLVKIGVEVACIDITESKPKLWLRGQDDDLRRRFGGGIHMIRPLADGRRDVVMAAIFEGCQIQWGIAS